MNPEFRRTAAERDLDDELSLAEIGAKLWAGRITIAVCTLAAAVLAAVIALLITPVFESTALLSPVSDDSDGSRFSGTSALLSQFGGLSALGGLNFSSSARASEALATLESRALTETYIQEKGLMPILFESSWDKELKAWKAKDTKQQPTLWKAEELFAKQIRSVEIDKKTKLVKLKITWKDPVLAATWANDLVRRANFFLRQKSIDQSNRNIGYLNDQLERTSVVELQKSIYGLIESEIKKVMIAQGSDEYAFRVIDPAAVPERKSAPKRTRIVLLGASAGFGIAAIFVLIRSRRSRIDRATATGAH